MEAGITGSQSRAEHFPLSIFYFLFALIMRLISKNGLVIALLLLTVPLSARTYTTKFPATENPICEGSPCNWIGGSAAGGNLWGDVQTSGYAFGVSEPTEFGDPTAILTGTWGPDQTVTGTVQINKTPTGSCCHEIELRLRMTIDSTAHTITGYEVYCSVMPSDKYCHIARWGGKNGRYCNIEPSAPSINLVNGDVFKATVAGNPPVLTAYRNGSQIMQVTDTGNEGGGGTDCGNGHAVYNSGGPGIGFYDNPDFNWSYFGFSDFTATDGGPSPPSGLKAQVK